LETFKSQRQAFVINSKRTDWVVLHPPDTHSRRSWDVNSSCTYVFTAQTTSALRFLFSQR